MQNIKNLYGFFFTRFMLMRIMIVLNRIARGGGENVAVQLANQFSRMGHTVFFVSNKERNNISDFYPIDENVQILPCFRHYFPLKIFSLRRAIKKENPDIIIGVMPDSTFYTYLAAIGLHKKIISSDHSSFEKNPYSQRHLFPYLLKFYFNAVYDCVTVLTKTDHDIVVKRFKKTVVMPNPLSIAPATAINTNKKKRILAAGRLNIWHCKGFDILIKAWARIQEKYPDWTVEIAGEGDKGRQYLESLIAENHLENRVILSGFHLNIKDFFDDSEIFVLSSRYEGFGMVLIEAMSQGAACIACDYKGRQREIIQNDSQGLCVESENEEALAKALSRMIEDEEYRKQVQENGWKRSLDFTPDKIGNNWARLFEELLGH